LTLVLALSVAGLALNAVGTVMVFVFGVPSRVKMGGDSFLAVGEYDETDHRRERLFTALGWAGLVAILLGAGLQGLALFMP
jgi:hypothetical protein